MSYCVNCGVELDKSAKKCVLCDTPIGAPLEQESAAPAPYSDNLFIPTSTGKRYVAVIISIVLLIPNIVCILTNMLFPETGIWAVYINATSALGFILFIVPFLFKKVYPYLLLLLDFLSILLYVYFFYSMYQERNWFFSIAVPMLVTLAVLIAFFLFWSSKKKRGWPYIMIELLTSISIFSLVTEALFHFYLQTPHLFQYSIIIVVSSICLVVLFLFVAKNTKFRNWLEKRLYL